KNQEHLETYLATADLSNGSNLAHSVGDPERLSRSRHQEQQPTVNGTNTPRELASKLKILELYILHVLPANNEWEYAKEFIQISELLDEERKDIFQQALSQLEAEKTEEGHTELDYSQRRDRTPDATEATDQDLLSAEPKPLEEDDHHPQSHRRSNSEQDYGIEELQKKRLNPIKPSAQAPTSSIPRATRQRNNNSKSSPSKLSPQKISTNSGLLARSGAVINAFQNLVSNMALSMSKNPLALLRFVLFLVALLVALSRRDVKDRVTRITGVGWEKVKRTVGMGVK
ncbi:MAG: hypothetical protein Q9192_008866, partial [Flavoplaca navasiana]